MHISTVSDPEFASETCPCSLAFWDALVNEQNKEKIKVWSRCRFRAAAHVSQLSSEANKALKRRNIWERIWRREGTGGRGERGGQQPCLQTDLALIDTLPNLNTVMRGRFTRWMLMPTRATSRGTRTLRCARPPEVTSRGGRSQKAGRVFCFLLQSHSTPLWAKGRWPPLPIELNHTSERLTSHFLSTSFSANIVNCLKVVFLPLKASCMLLEDEEDDSLNRLD